MAMLTKADLEAAKRTYHVYLSYAHIDDKRRERVRRIVDQLQAAFEAKSGEKLEIFIDRLDMRTGAIWEPRLFRAMDASCVMLAMASNAYFKSPVCGKEWHYFQNLEGRYDDELPNQGLIFPVKIDDWDAVLSEHQQLLRSDAERRQHYELDDALLDAGTATEKLASDIIEVLGSMAAAPAGVKHESYIFAKVGSDTEAFIARLADASTVTIVGITHQHLARYLEDALKRKRERDPHDFWKEINVVFVDESLLFGVRDELRRDFPNESAALAQRKLMGRRGSAAVQRFFLRADHPSAWQVLRYDAMLPFVGNYVLDRYGEQSVQIATLRPGFPTEDYVFLEFARSHTPIELNAYADTFSEIVRTSKRYDELIMTGTIHRDNGIMGFRLLNTVTRRSAWRTGMQQGMIPMVLLLLWQDDAGIPVPVLQIRTTENRARELETLSNVSCYILQEDCPQLPPGNAEGVELDETIVLNAAVREVSGELGIPQQRIGTLVRHAELRLVQPQHPDSFVLLYSVQIETADADEFAHLIRYSFEGILDVRLFEVLTKIQHVLELEDSFARTYSMDVLRQNLLLHDKAELADGLARYGSLSAQDRKRFLRRLTSLTAEVRRTFRFHGVDHPIRGLPRLQYREFFGAFLDAYARIGVPGAPECLERILADPQLVRARTAVIAHYRSGMRIAEDPAEQHA